MVPRSGPANRRVAVTSVTMAALPFVERDASAGDALLPSPPRARARGRRGEEAAARLGGGEKEKEISSRYTPAPARRVAAGIRAKTLPPGSARGRAGSL